MSPHDGHPLPHFDDGPRRTAAGDDGGGVDRTRREVMRTVFQAAGLVGLAMLGLFRSPRRAGAEPPPWTEIKNRANPNTGSACGIYQTTNQPCHTNMCAGTSADLMDSSNCTTSCANVDPRNPYQWHRHKTYGNVEYRDGVGFSCTPFDRAVGYDAWRWSAGNCGFCAPANYRCHDGQKRVVTSSTWAFTVCEGLAACNGNPTSC